MMPFKNLFNEWFIRDTSRKIRAVQRAKAERGERLGTRAPYGYRKDEQDRKKLVVDEEAAAVVRRIFALCAAGQGPSQIARLLKREQVLCPTTYAYKTFGVAHSSLNLNDPYGWSDSTIANMLRMRFTWATPSISGTAPVPTRTSGKWNIPEKSAWCWRIPTPPW